MHAAVTWSARAALLVVLAIALAGAVDPNHNAAGSVPPADVVEHALYGYLFTVLTIAALPRANPWLIGAAFLAVGCGFEALQAARLVSGGFEWKDMASNAAGVAAALAPLALGRRKRR
jgi:hypothetical protein